MISLVLPTFNEAKNIEKLVELLSGVLREVPYELLVVDDDSPDRTWEIAERMAKRHTQLRVLRRVGRKGLSSAVVEGFNLAKGTVLVVMDADGQHDPSVVLRLAEAVHGGAKIAVASRYVEGGGTGTWRGKRLRMSQIATVLARWIPSVSVSDPMSGFFAVDAVTYRNIATKLRPRGFKILFEILSCLPPHTPKAEVPLHFGERWAGESKLSFSVQLAFMAQLPRVLARRLTFAMRGRAQWVVFGVVCVVIALALIPRVYALQLLYTDVQVRSQVRETMERVATAEGWPLSDLQVMFVWRDAVMLRVRHHHRGEDETACVIALFAGGQAPC